jgi:hypothetical protein
MGMIKVSEEQKKVFIDTCEKLIESEGICNEIGCRDCPFFSEYQDNNLGCFENGHVSHYNINSKDLKLVDSAKKYLKTNKPPEITLEQALEVVKKEFGEEVVEEILENQKVEIDTRQGFDLLKVLNSFEANAMDGASWKSIVVTGVGSELFYDKWGRLFKKVKAPRKLLKVLEG